MKKLLWIWMIMCPLIWACDDKSVVSAGSPEFTLSGENLLAGDSLLFGRMAATELLAVECGVEWEVVWESQAAWCGAVRSALPGVNKLNVNVDDNTAAAERSCTFLLSNGERQRRITVCQIGNEPVMRVMPAAFSDLNPDSAVVKFRVVTNVPYQCAVTEGGEWILPLQQDGADTLQRRFAVRSNGVTARAGEIAVTQTGGGLSVRIPVFQNARATDYQPGSPDALARDLKLKIISGTSTGVVDGVVVDNFHNNSNVPIEKSFDGDYATQYNSKTADCFPVTLTYNLEQASSLDYIVYYPRQGSNRNGDFGTFSVEYQAGNGTFVKIGDYDFGMRTSASSIILPQTLEGVTSVRFIVTSGTAGFVSCGEMEFYQRLNGQAGELFTDITCSELKPGVTRAQIDALDDLNDGFLKAIASALYDKIYPLERVMVSQSYLPASAYAARLKTSGYNQFENPTGIYFPENTQAVVFVGSSDYPLSLQVVDWTQEGNEKRSVYPLMPGKNILNLTQRGLGYIRYETADGETAPDVKLHIATGQVNGFFDLENGDQNGKWMALLANTQSDCEILDIRGKYVQLAFDKTSLRSKNPNQGREMIEAYDEIILHEQNMMGVDRYGLRTNNRMFARRSYGGNPNANGLGVSFPSVNVVPENIRANSWEIGHEFGHVNQVRPGMKWQGTTEVTNNIYSAWVQFQYTPDNLRLEQEKIGDGEGGPSMVGNRFNCYFNNGILKGQNWLFQKGQNNPNPETGAGDLFVRLCPMWQLQLYNVAMGKADFYPELFERSRNMADGLSDKEYQFAFMRNTCEIMQADMSEFFEKCGMLKPVDRDVSDYGGARRLTITQQDVDAFRQEIAALGYSAPLSPVVWYISGNSFAAYRNKAAVSGVAGTGISGSGTSRIVSAPAWKNVVVFETYAGGNLVKITLPFTNYADKSATLVAYPDGSTRIEAVAWDGTRTLVYGTR